MTDCNKCNKPRTKVLVSNDAVKYVCGYCELWRMECEAIDLLKDSLGSRKERLSAIEMHRGKNAADKLKSVLTVLWQKNRPTE